MQRNNSTPNLKRNRVLEQDSLSSDTSVDVIEHTAKKTIATSDKEKRKQRRIEMLAEVQYEEKKLALRIALSNAELLLAKAQRGDKIADAETNSASSEIMECITNLKNAWMTIAQEDKSFSQYLQNLLQESTKNANDLLLKITELNAFILFRDAIESKLEQCSKTQAVLATLLESASPNMWTQNKNNIELSDIEKIVQINACASELAELKKQVRLLLTKMDKQNNYYKKNIGLLSTLNKVLNAAEHKDFLDKIERLNKLVKLKKALENSLSASKTAEYSSYLRSRIKSVEQDLIDGKNELIKSNQPTSTFTSNLFTKKIAQMQSKMPITTWKRGTDTSLQQYFLKAMLSDYDVAASISEIKNRAFNISFMEYIEDNQYKVLFAISGSNDPLNDIRQLGSVTGGVNAAVRNFLQSWNKANPGICFQYVDSYNGKNLKMDEGAWYCSEPKLSIEFGKIVKNQKDSPISIMGQNNWGVNPGKSEFVLEEQDACTRHCQPNQNELLNFVPNSPQRIIS